MSDLRILSSTLICGLLALPALAADDVPLRNWAPPPYWRPAAGSPEVPLAKTREMPVDDARTDPVVSPLAVTTPLPYVGIDPCRQYDSRATSPLPQNTPRSVVLTGAPCGIPTTALAVALNITIFNITGAASNGVFRVDVVSPPTTAWINYPPTETQRGNAGVAALTGAGEVVVQVNQGAGFVDFVVDVFGYYAPAVNGLALNAYSARTSGNLSMDDWGCMNFDPASFSRIRLDLPLPTGAVLTGVNVKIRDWTADGQITVYLRTVIWANGAGVSIGDGVASALLMSSDNRNDNVPLPGLSAPTPASPSFSYYINADAPAHTSLLSFCGASVTYTVN